MGKNQIIFIHGLWLHSTSWLPWMKFFKHHGYESLNPGWPGDSETVAGCRANPQLIANHSVAQVVDSYARLIASLPSKPILIGHSFGGMIVQELLGRDLAAAGIAIDPAPIKGVLQLPLSALRAALPVLGNPFNVSKAISLSHKQFKYAFTNTVSEQESKEVYDQWSIPCPARPLFQVAMATLNPNAETKVNTANATRGPLLITAGERDHTVPPILSKAAWRLYKKSSAITELKLFAGRGHSLTIDHGWTDVAEFSLRWLGEKGY